MAGRGIELPKKLKKDAIIEAVLELRFETDTLPEVLFGRLASYTPWKSLKQGRMALYNIPGAIRQADSNLRFQPIFELVSTDLKRAIRIGPRVLSFHIMAPYMGWGEFRVQLNEAIEQLFSNVESLNVRRIGLRYINALTKKDHGIHSIRDLDVEMKIGDEGIPGNVNLNFTTEISSNTLCTVRVATADFVQGVIPEGTSALIDVDVFTKDGFKTKVMEEVKSWVEFAHEKEKEEFFHLLPEKVIQALKED